MKPDKVVAGLLSYAEAEILPAMDGWRIWAGSFVLALIQQRADVIIAGLPETRPLPCWGLWTRRATSTWTRRLRRSRTPRKGKLSFELPGVGKFALGEADFDTLKEHILSAA